MAREHAAAVNTDASRTAVLPRNLRSVADAQNVFVFAMEISPRSADRLRELITPIHIRKSLDARLDQIQTLHFASMTVFEDQRLDPTLVLEANFDGRPGPFWADLEAAIGPRLRGMLRFCKRPSGAAGDMFDVVTAPDSQAPIAPLLEAVAVRPTAVHQGNRGARRAQIEQEAQLFGDVRRAMSNPQRFRGHSAQQIHQALREEFIDRPSVTMPLRAWAWPRLADVGKLFLFVALVILLLNLPGMLLAWLISPVWAAVIVFMLAIVALLWMLWPELTHLGAATKTKWSLSLLRQAALVLLILAVVEIVVVIIVAIVPIAFDALTHPSLAVTTTVSILRTSFDQPKNFVAALKSNPAVQQAFQQ
jgi:hypothetical protein